LPILLQIIRRHGIFCILLMGASDPSLPELAEKIIALFE
jgi:hypothetical protein